MSLLKNDRKVHALYEKAFQVYDPLSAERVGFAPAIASALHKQFGGTHAAVKTVVGLTGANERAVKNWFSAKNGPSGDYLIDLMRYSDRVLEVVLLMAGRGELVGAKKMVDARQKLREILAEMDDLQPQD
jgi:hypothetical protein